MWNLSGDLIKISFFFQGGKSNLRAKTCVQKRGWMREKKYCLQFTSSKHSSVFFVVVKYATFPSRHIKINSCKYVRSYYTGCTDMHAELLLPRT